MGSFCAFAALPFHLWTQAGLERYGEAVGINCNALGQGVDEYVITCRDRTLVLLDEVLLHAGALLTQETNWVKGATFGSRWFFMNWS